MDTKGPINPLLQKKSYIHVIVEAFNHFVVTVSIKSNNTITAVKSLLHHWIFKLGPPVYLVPDCGSEYNTNVVPHFCTLVGSCCCPGTPFSPWTNGLVEVQNKKSWHTSSYVPTKHTTRFGLSSPLVRLCPHFTIPLFFKRFPS